jgi:hypothetical protein
MDWGWIIIMALAILGAGSIAGGLVSYRGSARVGVKAFGAASVAVGIAMWAVVLRTAPATQSGGATSASTVEVAQSR